MRTLGAVYLGIATLYFLLPLEGLAQVGFGSFWLTLAPAVALFTTLLAWSRAAQGARTTWLLLSLACVAGITGQLLWNVEELVRQRPVPFPSPSFFLFMVFHPLLIAGILASLRTGRTRRTRVELTLDGAVAWSLITLVLLRLLFEPLMAAAPHLTIADQVYIVAGQMVVHAALVGAGVMIVWRDSVLPPRTVAALVGVTLANSTANFLSLARLDPDPGRVGDPFDLVWLAGWALLVYAGAAGAERGTAAWGGTHAADAARRLRNAVLPASILALCGVAVHLAVRGGGTPPTLVALGVSGILLAVRGAQAVRSEDRGEGERRELERTRGLVELSHTLAAAGPLGRALPTVPDWAARLLGAESAWIERIGPEGGVHCVGTHLGRSVESTLPLPQSVTAWLAGAHDCQICTRPEGPALLLPDGVNIAPRRWVATASIRFGGRMLGTLVVVQRDRALLPTETDLLGALADQAAITIENARLLDEARDSERSRLRAEKLASVGQLVAGVAHEINNPLASIRSAADLLATGDQDEETTSSIRLIQTEATRAAEIVRGMLDFVHPSELQVSAVDLADLLAASLRLRAYEHSVSDIRVRCDVTGLPPVRVDRNRLQQVFVNLIVNAEQAMAPVKRERVLHIHGALEGDTVALHVSDTGEGIRPQHIGRVFDPFFTTKRVGEGTGLGLSVSYGIIREMGGEISVASDPDVGTTFTLRLPAADAAELGTDRGSRGDVEARPALEDRVALHVLLVDDEANLRLMLSRALRRAGHTVKVAANGREALEQLDGSGFDVIVTDLKMPEMDGPELFARILSERPALVGRVLFMSGDTVGSDTRRFLDDSARPFLAKPFTLDEFARKVMDVAHAAARPADATAA